jgi:hypothetical protein
MLLSLYHYAFGCLLGGECIFSSAPAKYELSLHGRKTSAQFYPFVTFQTIINTQTLDGITPISGTKSSVQNSFNAAQNILSASHSQAFEAATIESEMDSLLVSEEVGTTSIAGGVTRGDSDMINRHCGAALSYGRGDH